MKIKKLFNNGSMLSHCLVIVFLFFISCCLSFSMVFRSALSKELTEKEKFIKEVENEVAGGINDKAWEGEKVSLKVIQLLKNIRVMVRVTIYINGEVREELHPLKNTRVHIVRTRDGKLMVDDETDDDGYLSDESTKKVGVGDYSLRPMTSYPEEPYYYASNFSLFETDRDKELDLSLSYSSVVYNALSGKPVNGAVIKLMDQDGQMVNGPFDHFSGSRKNPIPTGRQFSGGARTMTDAPRFGLFAGEFQYKNPSASIKAQNLSIKALIPEKEYRIGVDFVQNSDLAKKFNPVDQSGGQWTGYDTPYTGQAFKLLQEQPVGMQVPLVPRTALKVTKVSNKTRAQMGDIVAYQIKVENMSEDDTNPSFKIQIIDQPSVGLKYLKGTARINGQAIEPVMQGNQLVFEIDPLKAKGSPNNEDKNYIVYMATLSTSVVNSQVYSNKAFAQINGVTVSNVSTALVRAISSPFADESLLIGKVFIDVNRNGWQDGPDERGIGGIRLVMEDGTIVITDKNGKYSIPALKPGMHVIKLDTMTLPEGLVAISNTSRFLNISRGLMIKQNFALQEIKDVQDKALDVKKTTQ